MAQGRLTETGPAPVPGESRSPFRARWLKLRDRLLSDPRFQRWSSAFPLTRRIARKETQALFDLCAGFAYSQILAACVKLELFDMLADGPQPVARLAALMRMEESRAIRLLRAATALRLVEPAGADDWRLGRLGAALRGNPGALRMIEHHDLLYEDARDPVGLFRGEIDGTRLSRFWAYAGGGAAAMSDQDASAYSALMSASLSLVADDALDAFPLQGRASLLDVGGGEGGFVAAVAARYPGIRLGLFDAPAVAGRAAARLAGLGLANRVTTIGGDMFADRIPDGFGVISFVRVLHDHDDAEALGLLRAARAALGADGELLIAEPMAGGFGRSNEAYFGLYLLAMGRGRPRRPDEYLGMLAQAGFSRRRALPVRRPLLCSAIAAQP